MYRQYFSLEKKPFQISSDNQFLWLGKKHAAALELLKQGIAEKQGLLVLTGDIGTGKTTLINEIIHTLDAETQSVIIADPCLEMHHIFLTLAQAFGFEHQYQREKKFSAEFVSFLSGASTRGQKVLVIVDEAQRIPERFLKEIISWSGFGLNHVLTVILAGQLEFESVLRKKLGPDWQDVIRNHAFLEPLDESETKVYINKRLEFAGSTRKIFLVSAIHEVHIYSKGVPRLINIACDQSLIAAFAKGAKFVDVPTFKQALGQIDLPKIPPGKKNDPAEENRIPQGTRFQRKSLTGRTAFALTCLFAVYLYYGENGNAPLKKESFDSLPGLTSLALQPEKPELPAGSEFLPKAEEIQQSVVIQTPALQIQEPEEKNIPGEPEGQRIGLGYSTASFPEEREDLSPILINIPMEIEQTADIKKPDLKDADPKDIDWFIKEVFLFEGKPGATEYEDTADMATLDGTAAHGTGEFFEKNPRNDDSEVLKEPEPDAIIDWLMHKRDIQ